VTVEDLTTLQHEVLVRHVQAALGVTRRPATLLPTVR